MIFCDVNLKIKSLIRIINLFFMRLSTTKNLLINLNYFWIVVFVHQMIEHGDPQKN